MTPRARHRHPGPAEPADPLGLDRDRAAGLPVALLDPLDDVALDLLIGRHGITQCPHRSRGKLSLHFVHAPSTE
ncbi:hypothetical protein PI86_09570 [Burkholderia sp. A9]|nr:hypothetical protein PI86_09570 [Burkholderia sp. A9]